LKHLVPHLSKLLGGAKVLFADDCIGEQAYSTAKKMSKGEVLLLENLGFTKRKKKAM
jgi:phosphoglycerate kinase